MQKTKPILARSIETSPDGLTLVLATERVFIPWAECSKTLAAASHDQRVHAELLPSGYGIHWPLIDEDLSVGGLVRLAKKA